MYKIDAINYLLNLNKNRIKTHNFTCFRFYFYLIDF